jgi:plasmid stabilization system protein ParE
MKVRYSETALRELDEIFAYIYERNSSAAVAVIDRIERLALRQISWLKRCRHQKTAEGGYTGQPFPIGEAKYYRLGLAVSRDDGWLSSSGLIYHRR